MSSQINSLGTGQYYQLPTQNGDGTVAAPASITSNTSGTTSELASLLNGENDSVDLSPQAQSILDAMNSTSTSQPSATSPSASFSLSYAEQQKISEILSKYADAPLTQNTFDHIQSDLASAGLSASQLSQTDSLQSFNATQVFVDALNGKTDPISTSDDSAEQTKSQNYMQQIYSEWTNMEGSNASTASSSTEDSAGGTGGASA